ncbi:hypothetical protein L1887_39964 [Cichorium endivia]|nr:hypothetical protein L1887_39964 [Cichorium endivia]
MGTLYASAGIVAHATPYDYSFPTQCLENPNKPQYNGGIVANPELKDGLRGWVSFGNAKLQVRRSETGNEFIVAYQRNQSFDSVSQEFFMDKEKLYTFSAWVQISHEDDATVIATFKTATGFYDAGSTKAKSGCWSMLKGGLTVNESGSAQLYFQSKNPLIDIWIDSVSLQPFTQDEWKSHRYQSIEKVRKKLDVQPGPNQAASLEQVLREAHAHPAVNGIVMCASAGIVAHATPYDYSFPTQCLENPNKPQYNGGIVANPELKDGLRGWVSFGNAKLQVRRSETGNEFIVAYQRNQSFDSVSQEFFMDKEKLYTFSAWVQISHEDDATVIATFKTATGFYDAGSTKAKSGCWSMLKGGLTVNESGSAQLYFQSKNPLIDIWIDSVSLQPFTQDEWKSHRYQSIEKVRKKLDVQPGPNQAASLEQVLREAHAHPAVNGIVMWSAWSPKGCFRMCLTDNDFRNLPTGDVVDKIIREFFGAVATATTDADGYYETSLIHGDYEVRSADFDRHRSEKAPMSWGFKVEPLGSSQDVLNIKILG